jgi:hypothetical protein
MQSLLPILTFLYLDGPTINRFPAAILLLLKETSVPRPKETAVHVPEEQAVQVLVHFVKQYHLFALRYLG